MEEDDKAFEARLATEWTKRVGEAATALLIGGHDVEKQAQAEAALVKEFHLPANL